MEARHGGTGRGHMEWDLNDWMWDGDMFVATPLKTVQSDCRGKQIFQVGGSVGVNCAGEAEIGVTGRGRDELEKRRRVIAFREEEGGGRGSSLALNLGGVYPVTEEANGVNGDGGHYKRSKIQAGGSNRGMCQVQGCGADLGDAKDYHRRHKVCEVHAKASRAVVGNTVQRFCQQCSRFHLLQEFDEGKRSCRRRLAGHNKRRRKTHPDNGGNESSLLNDNASSYLLISLLRILSNLQSDGNGQSKDQDLLWHLLTNLANLAGSFDSRNIASLLQASQVQHNAGNCAGPSSDAVLPIISECIVPNELPKRLNVQDIPNSNRTAHESFGRRADAIVERSGVKNFDLNDVYNDETDDMEEPEQIENLTKLGTASPSCPAWLQESHQSSPTQMSGHSNSQSSDSRASSNGDTQSRTERIVFKLFGKDPNDIPFELRKQVLGWLSSTPSDAESYMRPGCIILTLYLRLPESTWNELSHTLSAGLRKLLSMTSSDFWKMGWIYVRLKHQMAFIYNGQLLLDASLLQSSHSHCRIWSISPLAASISGRVSFTVKGSNLVQSMTRLLCSFEGKYLVEEAIQCSGSETVAISSSDMFQSLRFTCSIPSTSGRGFIEVEDQGLSSAFFPFIVAETDICTEICTLESMIDLACSADRREDSVETRNRDRAINFLHEMGWLLRRLQLVSKLEDGDSCSNLFPLTRLKWLLEFALDHDWRAIVKKLLDTLVTGFVDTGGCPMEGVLSEISPLHRAVRNNSRSLVETLLRYKPPTVMEAHKLRTGTAASGFLIGPDMVTSHGVTPLHIVASRGDALGVLDALTDDPRQVGVMAWKTARDSSGCTPEDYARSRGFDSYLKLVDKKIGERSGGGHVTLEITTGSSMSSRIVPEEGEMVFSSKPSGFEIDTGVRMPPRLSHCKLCSKQELAYIDQRRPSILYRPAMLMMVGIAAVCVCVGLLLKGPPEVVYVLSPFRWELLEYGPI